MSEEEEKLFELSDTMRVLNRQVYVDAAGKRHVESAKANKAFRTFCQLGPERSVQRVSVLLSKSRTFVSRWCQKWAWRERVRAYDDKMHEAEVAGYIKARKAMTTRQAKLAVEAQGVVEVALMELKKRLAQKRHRHLRPGEIARLLEVSTKIERICLGDPDTENDQVAAINVKICLQDRPRYLDADSRPIGAADAIDLEDLRSMDS
jgi:hypothetical protein